MAIAVADVVELLTDLPFGKVEAGGIASAHGCGGVVARFVRACLGREMHELRGPGRLCSPTVVSEQQDNVTNGRNTWR